MQGSINELCAVIANGRDYRNLYRSKVGSVEHVDVNVDLRVSSGREAASVIQRVVTNLGYIRDCAVKELKAGKVSDWEVDLRDNNEALLQRIDQLLADKAVLPEEYNNFVNLVKKRDNDKAAAAALSRLARFHIVRWSAKDVKAGKKRLHNGGSVDLADALTSGTEVKLVVQRWQGKQHVILTVYYTIRVGGVVMSSKTTPNPLEQSRQLWGAGEHYRAACKMSMGGADYPVLSHPWVEGAVNELALLDKFEAVGQAGGPSFDETMHVLKYTRPDWLGSIQNQAQFLQKVRSDRKSLIQKLDTYVAEHGYE